MSRWRWILIVLISYSVGMNQSVLALDTTIWLPAYRAYTHGDYATAHTGYARLLQTALTPAEREECLWQDVQCLQQLQRFPEMGAALDALAQVAPRSAYVKLARPLFYRSALARGDRAQATTLWTDTLQHWQEIPSLWEVVSLHLTTLAAHTPEAVPGAADDLCRLPVVASAYMNGVYRPLLASNHLAEARALHAAMQTRLTRDPLRATQEQTGYDDAWARDLIDKLYAQFTTALAHDDAGTMTAVLETMNTMIPEYPEAVTARQQYREYLTLQQKRE